MSHPIAVSPELDYVLNKDARLGVLHFFKDGLYSEFLWLRDLFVSYCTFAKVKPYHSATYFNFVNDLRCKRFVQDNNTQRRFVNVHKSFMLANLRISEDLTNSFTQVAFYRVNAKPKYSAVEVKVRGSEYVHRVLAQKTVMVESIRKDLPILEIGGGDKERYGAGSNWDLIFGKDLNSIKSSDVESKMLIANQSFYHISPALADMLVTQKMIVTNTYFTKTAMNVVGSGEITTISGNIGNRTVLNEHNYHPKYFRKRGFEVYADFTTEAGAKPFVAVNFLDPPKRILSVKSALFTMRAIGQGHRIKLPLSKNLSIIKDYDMFAQTSFYQTKKIDGMVGKIIVESTKVRLLDRTGVIYTVNIPPLDTRSYKELYVEYLVRKESMHHDQPEITVELYFLAMIDGSYLWEDIALITSILPGIGIKAYRYVPYNSMIHIDDESDYPYDGVVYVPVLSNSAIVAVNYAPLSVHYYFKVCPTFDLGYGELKDINRMHGLHYYLGGHEKNYKDVFPNYNDTNITLPFVYEVSVFEEKGKPRYVVTHVRMDKRKVDTLLVPVVSERNKKGLFYFTKCGVDYNDSVLRFFSNLNEDRRLLPFNVYESQDKYCDLLMEKIKRHYKYEAGVLEVEAYDLYAYLKTQTSDSVALFFMEVLVKNSSVAKNYVYKMGKIFCHFTFNIDPVYEDIKRLYAPTLSNQKVRF